MPPLEERDAIKKEFLKTFKPQETVLLNYNSYVTCYL